MTIYFQLCVILQFKLLILIPFQLFIGISPPLYTYFPSSRNRKDLVGVELVYIYTDGMWVEFVYRNQQNNVVGETIPYLVRPKPPPFEFFDGGFFWTLETTRHGHCKQMLFFLVLVHPSYQVGLLFHCRFKSNLVGFLQLFQVNYLVR